VASTWLDATIVADEICEQIELQAKLLNYFLGSNKSNINQKAAAGIERCPDFSCVEWHGDCDDTTGCVSFGG